MHPDLISRNWYAYVNTHNQYYYNNGIVIITIIRRNQQGLAYKMQESTG